MFKNRAFKKELLDDLSFDAEVFKRNLDEMEFFNQYFGSKKLLLKALNKIQNKYHKFFIENKIVIADLGCGSADLLRAMDDWARSKKLDVELIGIDLKSFIIQYAIEKSCLHPDIHFQVENILSKEFKRYSFDIVCLNSVCHHFDNISLIKLLKNLREQTRLAIIINDLHRHWLSYFSVKFLTRLFCFSYLTKNDGPLSVLRAFKKHELIQLLYQANENNYQIRWVWPFRWEIIIWLS